MTRAQWIRCNTCGLEKSPDDFTRPDHEKKCRDCARAYHRAYRARNLERERERSRRSYQKNRTKRLEAARANYEANRETKLAYVSDYSRRNPHVNQDASRRSRIRRRGLLPGDYSALEVYERDGGRCQLRLTCDGKRLNKRGVSKRRPNGYTLDHVIPLSRGGQDTLENVVLACAPCNSAKGNRDLSDVKREAS